MLTIPQHYLTPLIAILAFISIYSIVGNPRPPSDHRARRVRLDLRKLDFAPAPVILSFELSGLFENNLRRALSISGGDWSILL